MNFSWRIRRLHPSWLLAALFLGMTIGVICSKWVSWPGLESVAWLLCGIALTGLSLWRQRGAYLLVVMIMAGGMIGMWRGDGYLRQLSPYASLAGQVVTVQGKLTDDPDKGSHGELVLRLSKIAVNGHLLKGNVWVSSSSKVDLRRSDEITVKGKINAGFGSLAASMYRAELVKVERPQPGDVALRMRDWFAGGVREAIPEPEASLGVGYVVGQRRALPDELDKALRAAGLTHIVVASGYNLTILIEVARRFFSKISKFMAAFSGGGLIIGFIAVAGLSPSMSRAGLVAALSLLAWYYGRRFHPIVLLSLAAAVTLLINPAYGWNDLGWQLSFASFAGVMLVGPLLQRYFFGEDEPGLIRQIFGETISAWLCTLPLIVLAFGQFSNVAILANLLVLPLVPLAMALTLVAGVGALLVPPAAPFVGLPARLVLGYTTHVAGYLGSLSWAQTVLAITPFILAVYYMLLVGLCGYMWHRTRVPAVLTVVE